MLLQLFCNLCLHYPTYLHYDIIKTIHRSTLKPPPRVLLTHEDFVDVPGAWAVSPLLLGNGLLESAVRNAAKQQRIDAAVENLISGNDEEEVMENQPVIKWLVVCEARSHIVLSRLVERLDGENHEKVCVV